ncbi:MFS transporter [Ruminiclostridium herbifermentans]|uniref:MFS transporter n=1 Tax=Ruminiclostridium herbifermentans TaxID=2488810 RepID=A0A7H1VTN7_9FIRM|nr:MDR family MFS transporter [Ruminiclostridium herbifermentans]QNU68749.1 MFS transporter [Ruminiclostridium herbifermentans]
MEETIKKKKSGLGMIMFLYMLGIFMGAIDTGIVTPARTVIQSSLGVDDKLGIWMITIFTLAYAASIPISGKIADRIGRKHVYIVCITLFGAGSLLCGLSSSFSSFSMLLTGRVIQAIGGGGIMPIANAEFGTTFPEEKRGMALGLLGGVYGLANIMGSSLGSAILDIFGIENWQFLFYINLPISIVIIVFGIKFLPLNKSTEAPKKIDVWGTFVIVVMILSVMYGLKNIDFFNFSETIKSTSVYPYLIIFIVLLPIFIIIEKRAADPILNLSYFTTPKILITLIVGFLVGVCMMGMIFVPQFSENSLRIATGKGGYFVTILGVFTAIGAPMSGKLVDKYGAKKILLGGFIVSLIGSIFLAYVAVPISGLLTVIVSLALIGTGLGFVMGSPLNYMMLGNTKQEEANSALATLSLVRSIGTVIAPSIMIGFLAQAGLVAQDNLMSMLPKPTVPEIKQAVELNDTFNKMKTDPNMAEMLKDVDIPDLSKMGDMNFDMSSGGSLPDELVKSMQSADVTNIVDKSKEIAVYMMDKNLPTAMEKAQEGIQKGIDAMSPGFDGIDDGISQIKEGIAGMDTGIAEMSKPIKGLTQALDGMKKGISQQEEAIKQMTALYNQLTSETAKPPVFAGVMPNDSQMKSNASSRETEISRGMSGMSSDMAKSGAEMPSGSGMPSGAGMPGSADMQKYMKDPNLLKTEINKLTTAKNALKAEYKETLSKKEALEKQVEETKKKQALMKESISSMEQQKVSLNETINKMKDLKDKYIPQAFEQSKTDYLKAIDNMKPQIEDSFQSTLGNGFKQMYITVSVFSILSILLLIFYRDPKKTF